MGLEASVMCTCYVDHSVKPSPFLDRFFVNEAGFPDFHPAPESHPGLEAEAFQVWLQTCCAHPGMDYARRYVASWVDYRRFLSVLETAGAGQFPALLSALPAEDSGITPAHVAAAALTELAIFRALDVVGSNRFVVNTETGDPLYAYVPEHRGIFIWDGHNGHNIGVDADGLFIEDAWELSRTIFRAQRVEQRLLDAAKVERSGSGEVVYTDLDSGRRLICKTPIPGKEIPWDDGRMRNDEGRFRLEYPRFIHVEARPLHATDFEATVEPLSQVFRAAQETGNPVRWT